MDEKALARESVGLLRERSLEERGGGLQQATGKALDDLVYTMTGFKRWAPVLPGAPWETDAALRKRVLSALEVNRVASLHINGAPVAVGRVVLSEDQTTLHIDLRATRPASVERIEFSTNITGEASPSSAQGAPHGAK